MAGFVPDPSWPSILELGIMVWGKVTRRHGDELFFGSHEGRKINSVTNIWHDFEANTGGGYRELWQMANPGEAWPPAKPNGHAQPGGGGHHKDGPWNHIDKLYDYRAADGTLILQVVRTHTTWGQRFSQRRPDASKKGGWGWRTRDIPDADKPLYRLPQLLASKATTVFVVEGEKDADNLAKLGLTATCNIGGAGKWQPHYSEALRGRHVVILPDNDPQASYADGAPKWHPDGRPVLVGQDHAEMVAAALHPVAASVRVVMLPGLLPKGDVSDWLASGGTKDELEWHARETPLWEPPAVPPPPPMPDPPVADEVEDDDEGPPEIPPADDPDGPDGMPGGDDVSEQYAMRLFVAANREELRYNHSANAWLVWDKHFWRQDGCQTALAWIMNLSSQLADTINGRGALARRRVVMRVTFSSNIERGARAMPPFATAQDDWDADHWSLGTPGGVVDLKTAMLRDGKREDMISRTTSFTPSEMPDCPTWISFLHYAMNDDEQLVRFLQRYFGYCLTGRTNEEAFLFMFGPGGAGKGTLIETVAHILGDYAGTAPMEVFAASNVRTNAEYYRADLAAKRMVIANEPERGAYWAEAFIKETTGGDTISARHPMGRPFRFKPTHKLAMQGNHMPSLRGRSTGMERRLLILPVTRKPKVPDLNLKQKLLAEAPGILRWMIEGCLAWQKIGLAPPDSVKKAGENYFTAQNNFMRWVEERCTLDNRKRETPTSLRLSFNTWAKLNGEPEMDGKAFAEAIDMSDLPLKRGKSGSERYVEGIQINVQQIGEIPPAPSWVD